MRIHQLEGYIQSIYLVEYPDRLLLLDGCSRADIRTLKNYITQTLKRPLDDLKIIFVSHMHPDHAGGAHTLREMTGAKIASANKSESWYKGFDGILMHLTDIYLTAWVASRMKKPKRYLWYSRTLKTDYKLNDGDSIPLFDEWLVLETPGHTDRDLSVMHQPSKKIYVGDVILKVRGEYISPAFVVYPNRYKASLKRYIDLGIDNMLLAHGGEVQITQQDIKRLIDKAPSKPKTLWGGAKAKMRMMVQGR